MKKNQYNVPAIKVRVIEAERILASMSATDAKGSGQQLSKEAFPADVEGEKISIWPE
ncbi:MAG: hypothetical protein K5893_08655 [Prevotella sp.]|nr:hypothetical protein [Prevotella sp.]